MIVSLDMAEESAELLVSMYINGDSTLAQFQIKKVELYQDASTAKEDGHVRVTDGGTQTNAKLLDNQFDTRNLASRGKLRRSIIAYFSENDIRNICFDLNIDYEKIPGDSKDAKVRELLSLCEREGILEGFISACCQERPTIIL